MVGQRIGYVRVSSLDQNERRQLEGQVLDRVFTDKASGKDTTRPELTELLRFARDGDTVVVHSMDRLAGKGNAGWPVMTRATRRTLTWCLPPYE